MVKRVHFAILTDIHAHDPDGGKKAMHSSWVRTDGSRSAPHGDPFASITELVEREKLRADYVLCGGDMTDKAHPASQNYVWTKLHDLRAALKAKKVIATAGNHDLDSREVFGDADPKGSLQSLIPRFPIDVEKLSDKYWANNYFVANFSGVRVVNLNSAAFHGLGADLEKEYNRGRIADRTIEELSRDLANGGFCCSNLLLCHHHPFRNNQMPLADTSEIHGGDKLIAELTDLGVGDWIVVHGHRHLPKLMYAHGGAAAPTILSAGSFSVNLEGISPRTRNEFYILELEIAEAGELPVMRGKVRSWTWEVRLGWREGSWESGLPSGAGFGSRKHPAELARQIRAEVGKSTVKPTSWADITAQIPDLQYTLPTDIAATLKMLENSGVGVHYDADRKPAMLQLRRA